MNLFFAHEPSPKRPLPSAPPTFPAACHLQRKKKKKKVKVMKKEKTLKTLPRAHEPASPPDKDSSVREIYYINLSFRRLVNLLYKFIFRGLLRMCADSAGSQRVCMIEMPRRRCVARVTW